MLKQLIDNRWFALISLLLVILSGLVWIFIPRLGLWCTLIALLPSGLRMFGGLPPVKRTPFDWLILVFLITALTGYWAAYNKSSAWIKLWLIITSILIYYSLSAQPKQNFGLVSLGSFCLAFGISIYFFLANDYVVSDKSIALWWMQNRPQVNLPDIHHGYISGLLIITSIVASYWLWNVWKQFNKKITLIVMLAVAVTGLAFIQTTSRGIWATAAWGVGIWLIWKITRSNKLLRKPSTNFLFPVLTLIYLGAVIVFVYLGPARVVEEPSQSDYGTNSRAELQGRGTYFLTDYPITGGGLNSFPGLYSQYMIVIPFFYFVNSYNLFLDVGIEQGIIGGLAFLFIYLGSVWLVAKKIAISQSRQTRFIGWLCLLMLNVIIIHGLFYDYLYHGPATIFLLAPIGISMAVLNVKEFDDEFFQLTKMPFDVWGINIRKKMYFLVIGTIVLTSLNINRIKSIWYANLGAVQMAQAELISFPTNSWSGNEILPTLKMAEDTLISSLRLDPVNRTANQRLGMIAMYRQDFASAVDYLEEAHNQSPNHRGIIKLLGYSYVWLGDIEMAQSLLSQIPEAHEELDVYIWWWESQGRNDLSKNAVLILNSLDSTSP